MNQWRIHTIILWTYAVLLSLLLIFRVGQVIGEYAPNWDESHHLTMGFRYYNAFREKNWEAISRYFFQSEQMYPPFMHWSIALSYKLFGLTPKSAFYINIPFIFIFVFSTYKLGSLINKNVGLASALLTPLLPIFMYLSQNIFLDFASVSVFLAFYYTLLRSNHFQSTRYAILSGIFLSLNILIKWTALVPALSLCIYYLYSFRQAKNIRSILIHTVIILGLCMPGIAWVLSNQHYIYKTLHFFGNENNFPQIIWNTPSGLTWKNILLYPTFYAPGSAGFGLIPLLIFLTALILKRGYSLSEKYYLASIGLLYLVLTSINDKADKYFAYAYPLMVIITANWLFSLRKKWLAITLSLCMVGSIVGNALYANLVFPQARQILSPLTVYGNPIPLFPSFETNLYKAYWPNAEIISKHIDTSDGSKSLLVLPDTKRVNPPSMRYLKNIQYKNMTVADGYFAFDPTVATIANYEKLYIYDYILVKDGNPGMFANQAAMESIIAYLKNSDRFELVATFFTIYDENIYLYKNNEVIY